MTILATILLAILALFGFRVSNHEEVPLEAKPAEVQASAQDYAVVLDDDTHGHLEWAEGAKLIGTAHGVLQERLGPKYEVINLATLPGEPLAIAVTAKGGGGYRSVTLEKLLTSTGVIDITPLATDDDLRLANTTLAEETACLEAWRRQRPDAYLENFNGIRTEDGGPPRSMRWVRSGVADPAFRLVRRPVGASTRFTNVDFQNIRGTLDDAGRPALGFEVKKPRQADFEAFTTALQGKQMAIIVGEEILTAPTVNTPLRAGGLITGGRLGFSDEEVRDLVILMNHPLPGIYLRN